jgi:phosphoglycolate phosphatase-like HAD superfamily hydrolase
VADGCLFATLRASRVVQRRRRAQELVRSELSQAGLQIPNECLLTSTIVGHRKPHPAGFRNLAERLAVRCHDLSYVGNERKDVDGGKAVGCRTALVWRGSGEPPAWGQDATIRSLEELRELLQE